MKECLRVRVCAYCEFVTCHTRTCCIYILLISDHHGYSRIFLKSSFWIHSRQIFVRTVCGETLSRTHDFSSEGYVCKIRCKRCLYGFLTYNLSAERKFGEKILVWKRLLRTSRVKLIFETTLRRSTVYSSCVKCKNHVYVHAFTCYCYAIISFRL